MTLEIFWVFLRISFLSFGGVFGVLPELERMVVTQHHWLTHEKFLQAYVLGQFSPGPNMSMCAVIGYWLDSWPGFFAAFIGIYTGPIIVMSLGYAIYHRHRSISWVRRCERAVRPLILGLLLSASLRVWWLQTDDERGVWLVRGMSFIFLAALWFVYQRKWLGSFSLIFVAGLVWFGLIAATLGV